MEKDANQHVPLLGTKLPLKVNMFLNAVKGFMSVFFPLITFPYISRVLGVEGIGKYNFAFSIIHYFLLIAGLGINQYAIREGSGIRDRKEFPRFVNEVFSISLVVTVVAYGLLAIMIFLMPQLKDYSSLLLVLSLQIIFTTLGVEWIYSIFEDYAYITLRTFLFQLLSLILMFVFVRTSDDLLIYAVTVTLSSTGANIINGFHARQYCRIRPTKRIDWKRHMKPILILFGMSLTVMIYTASDTTILGVLCGDYTVGIYSASVKVYTVVVRVLSSILVVSIPRLSSLLGKKEKQAFDREAVDIYSTLLTFVVPAIIGIILLRKQIILLLSCSAFLPATSSLALLAFALFFCMGAWFWGQCILLPMKMEAKSFKITIVSALANIVFNFLLIPLWKENAAALTTILAEGISFFGCRYFGRKYVSIKGIGTIIAKVLAGCIAIAAVCLFLQLLLPNLLAYTILAVLVSVIVYCIVEVLLRNQVMVNILHIVQSRLQKSKKSKNQQ